MSGLTIRRSIQELDYNPDLAKEKNDYLKAWKMIKELPPSNPNSFWSIATYHGMPFKKRTVPPFNPPAGEMVWDSYCQHANVLFPIWHRYYCLRLEQALQTAVPGTALHYWDQTLILAGSPNPVPRLLTAETVEIDGVSCPNPLFSFQLPRGIDGYKPHSYYVKPDGYVTQRYPFSGVQNPPSAKEEADKHNDEVNNMNDSPQLLFEKNLISWLYEGEVIDGNPNGRDNCVYETYRRSLDSPYYNTFSNTKSAGKYHSDAVEQPHNDIHLAVGGFTDFEPEKDGKIHFFGFVEGANGDMGANEVAAFDPAFFLHHANVDRMFWVWQKKWGLTDSFKIVQDDNDPGITPAQGQGPTVDQTTNEKLTLTTPMPPFQDEYGVPRLAGGCMNIRNMGFDYSIGSFDQEHWPAPKFHAQRVVHRIMRKERSFRELDHSLIEELGNKGDDPLKILVDFTDHVGNSTEYDSVHFKNPDQRIITFHDRKWQRSFHISVEGIEKDAYPGSFMVCAVQKVKGVWQKVGKKGVLDRYDRIGCPNCQTRRLASIHLYIPFDPEMTKDDFKVYVVYKDPLTGKPKVNPVDVESKEAGKPKVKFILKSIELRE